MTTSANIKRTREQARAYVEFRRALKLHAQIAAHELHAERGGARKGMAVEQLAKRIENSVLGRAVTKRADGESLETRVADAREKVAAALALDPSSRAIRAG